MPCFEVVRAAGVEPTTSGFGGQRSIQLSYARLTLYSNSERLRCIKEAGGYYALGKRDRKQIRCIGSSPTTRAASRRLFQTPLGQALGLGCACVRLRAGFDE